MWAAPPQSSKSPPVCSPKPIHPFTTLYRAHTGMHTDSRPSRACRRIRPGILLVWPRCHHPYDKSICSGCVVPSARHQPVPTRSFQACTKNIGRCNIQTLTYLAIGAFMDGEISLSCSTNLQFKGLDGSPAHCNAEDAPYAHTAAEQRTSATRSAPAAHLDIVTPHCVFPRRQ